MTATSATSAHPHPRLLPATQMTSRTPAPRSLAVRVPVHQLGELRPREPLVALPPPAAPRQRAAPDDDGAYLLLAGVNLELHRAAGLRQIEYLNLRRHPVFPDGLLLSRRHLCTPRRRRKF